MHWIPNALVYLSHFLFQQPIAQNDGIVTNTQKKKYVYLILCHCDRQLAIAVAKLYKPHLWDRSFNLMHCETKLSNNFLMSLIMEIEQNFHSLYAVNLMYILKATKWLRHLCTIKFKWENRWEWNVSQDTLVGWKETNCNDPSRVIQRENNQ